MHFPVLVQDELHEFVRVGEKAMGSPPEMKSKQCSTGVILSVVGVFLLALLIGAVVSFFITKNIYSESAGKEDAFVEDLSPKIDDLLLPTPLSPKTYDLSMKVYLPGYTNFPEEKNFTFDGQVKIEMEVLKSVRKITLNSKNLDIPNGKTEVTADGKPIKVKAITTDEKLEKVFFDLDDAIYPGQNVEMKIQYTGEINTDLGGLYQTSYTTSDGKPKTAAVTQMQAMSARKMVPCFDEPSYKANWTVSIIHPKGTRAIANGIEKGDPSTIDKDFINTHFQTTPKMSSYLLALFISEFDYIEDKTKTNIRFRIWSRPEAKNMTQYALKAGIKCIEFYEQYYKIPFPLEKQDMVALPDFGAGAMENWGLITYRENALLYDEKLYKPSEKLRVATVIAHELAHQWFGNLVTMKWWEDLWLNEGFATLVEYLGADEISDGKFKMTDYFLVDAFSDALKSDETASSHPLTHRIDKSAEIDESFDGITYQKGGSVLTMIRAAMGEQNFLNGVRQYLNNHSYSNAAASDLLKAFDEAATSVVGPRGEHLNVTDFARKWTHQMGFPYLTLERLNNTHGKIIQKRYKLDPEAKEKDKFAVSEYKFKWDVPVWIQNGKNKPEKTWLRDDEDLIIPVGNDPVVLNAEAHAFVRMNYQKDDWKAIFDQLKKDYSMFSARTRYAIISDAFAMAEIGELTYEQLFDLFDYISKETDYLPWSAFRSQFAGLLHYFGTEPESKDAQAYYAKLLKPQFDKASIQHITDNYLNDDIFFENLQEAAVYLTYCDYDKPKCKEELRTLYETNVKEKCNKKGTVASECSTVAPPLRFIVYCRAVEDGDDSDFDMMMRLYKAEPVQVERNKLMDALGCSKDPRTLKTLLSLAVDREANVFRFQDVSSVFFGVAVNDIGKEIVFNFLMEHWNDIYNSFSEVHDTINRIVSSCAGGIRTRSQLEQLKTFHKTAENAAQFDSLRVQALAAEQRLKWLDTHLKPLSKLFKERL